MRRQGNTYIGSGDLDLIPAVKSKGDSGGEAYGPSGGLKSHNSTHSFMLPFLLLVVYLLRDQQHLTPAKGFDATIRIPPFLFYPSTRALS